MDPVDENRIALFAAELLPYSEAFIYDKSAIIADITSMCSLRGANLPIVSRIRT